MCSCGANFTTLTNSFEIVDMGGVTCTFTLQKPKAD